MKIKTALLLITILLFTGCLAEKQPAPLATPTGCLAEEQPAPLATPTGCLAEEQPAPFATPTGCLAEEQPAPLATPTGCLQVPVQYSTIQKAIDTISPGGCIQVSAGTYNESLTISKSISLDSSGAIVKSISVSGSGVTVSGFEVANGAGITIAGQGHIIENNYVHDLATVSNGGIAVYQQPNSSNITIRNNVIVRAFNSCVFISGNNHTIDSNDCSQTRQPTGGDADCFRVFGANHAIKNNYCHDIWYGQSVTTAHVDCVQTWHWTDQGGALRDSVIEYNYCDLPDQTETVSGKAFQMSGVTGSNATPDPRYPYPCRNNVFRYNIAHDNLLALFWYCENMTVTNNTFIGDADVDSDGIHIYYSRGTNKVQYNIFVDQDERVFYGNTTESINSIVGGYNCIYRSIGAPFGLPRTGDIWDQDPLFVDASNGNYRLRSASPCLGMGAYPSPVPATPTFTAIPSTPACERIWFPDLDLWVEVCKP